MLSGRSECYEVNVVLEGMNVVREDVNVVRQEVTVWQGFNFREEMNVVRREGVLSESLVNARFEVFILGEKYEGVMNGVEAGVCG